MEVQYLEADIHCLAAYQGVVISYRIRANAGQRALNEHLSFALMAEEARTKVYGLIVYELVKETIYVNFISLIFISGTSLTAFHRTVRVSSYSEDLRCQPFAFRS